MITTLQSKITSRNNFGLKEYSRKSYIDKVNPQVNIEKKKQNKKIQRLMTEVSHKVSTIEKINQKSLHQILKKKTELNYLERVRSRVHDDRIKKENIHFMKTEDLHKKRLYTLKNKKLSRERLEYSKFQYTTIKKTLADNIKRQREALSSQMRDYELRKSLRNRNIVERVQSSKEKGRQSINSFYKQKNAKQVFRLSRSIDSETEKSMKNSCEISLMEKKKQREELKRKELSEALQKISLKMEQLSESNFKGSLAGSRYSQNRSYSHSTANKSNSLKERERNKENEKIFKKFSIYCGGGLYKYSPS